MKELGEEIHDLQEEQKEEIQDKATKKTQERNQRWADEFYNDIPKEDIVDTKDLWID